MPVTILVLIGSVYSTYSTPSQWNRIRTAIRNATRNGKISTWTPQSLTFRLRVKTGVRFKVRVRFGSELKLKIGLGLELGSG